VPAAPLLVPSLSRLRLLILVASKNYRKGGAPRFSLTRALTPILLTQAKRPPPGEGDGRGSKTPQDGLRRKAGRHRNQLSLSRDHTDDRNQCGEVTRKS
jgi:hypothetical protein